jgi:hypothetical protein
VATLAEMFTDQGAMTFEERVAEVIAIVSSAADFAGVDHGLRAMFQQMCAARDEREFDEVFDHLVVSLSENTTRYLQSA